MFSRKCGFLAGGELSCALGIPHIISLCQESYIDEHFKPQDAITVTTPLAPSAILTNDQCPATLEELRDMDGNDYRELIESLRYTALDTRLGINLATSKLAQFLTNPAVCIYRPLCVSHDISTVPKRGASI